jgi:hypothetical protein
MDAFSARIENGCMQFIPKTHMLGVVTHVYRGYLAIGAALKFE